MFLNLKICLTIVLQKLGFQELDVKMRNSMAYSLYKSHVSFVYYLNIPPYSHTTKFLNRDNLNSLFLGANSIIIDDKNMIKEFNSQNAETFFIHPKEGHVSLFPSRLTHGTECIKTDFEGERLAIVGDCNLILKDEHLLHSMGLIDEKYWKKYE